MGDVVDSDEYSVEEKQSRRAIFKNAISRTRSKFKKTDDHDNKDFKLSDDVNDFLAAGRTATPTKSSFETAVLTPSSAVSTITQSQPSPRGPPVPRLDLSQTTRFPGARALEHNPRPHSDEFLRPYDKYQRSQSLSSFKKRRIKPRNLSVSFDNMAPVIIGEGGDEAEMPPAEISRSHHRARSLSPMMRRPGSGHSGSSIESPPVRRKPLPGTLQSHDDSDFRPRPVQRVQTGFDESMRSAADREFDQILSPKWGTTGQGSGSPTPLHSPKPIRPPVPLPSVDGQPLTVNASQSPPKVQPMVMSNNPAKQAAVQIMVHEDQYQPRVEQQSPPPSYFSGVNVNTTNPVQTFTHRTRPAVNETETMGHGVSGWL